MHSSARVLFYLTDAAIKISGGSFSWLKDQPRILHCIEMTVKTNSLTSIVGSLGAGKSTLLSAIAGDIYKHEGQVVISVSIQFTSV